jgi:hypothetical protein
MLTDVGEFTMHSFDGALHVRDHPGAAYALEQEPAEARCHVYAKYGQQRRAACVRTRK